MSVLEWLAYGAFVGFLAAGFWRLPRLWRNEAPGLRAMPAGWPWGPALWRGFVRSVPAALLVGTIGVGSLPVLLAAPHQSVGPFERELAVVIPFFVLFTLSVSAMVGIVLFNRPKFLVPPHMREQTGAAFELRADQRRRRGDRRR